MSFPILLCSGLLIAVALVQMPYAVVFVRALLRRPPSPVSDERCGRARVLLPLRGGDPELRNCIEALIRQDYPRYDVVIVVDSPEDPAWAIVESALRIHPAPHVRVEALATRLPSCSLKCSSMLQGLSDLDASHAFVALLDGDTVPHATWLREIAAGFEDPSVGAVTGNRWYAPEVATWGALVRRLWNAAAIPQMYVYDIAWGGSMAVRADAIHAAHLRERWSRAYGDDTAVTSALRHLGLRTRFLPSLMMVSREDCTLGEFDEWVRRQLISARLQHPAWLVVSGHGAVTSFVLALVLLLGTRALLLGDGPGALVSLAALLAYQACMFCGLLALDAGVRHVVVERGEALPRPSPATWLKSAAAIPLTQAVYARALAASAFAKRVTWRGVPYDILGRGEIRVAGNGAPSCEGADSPGTRGTS